jgi:hypothetical protein
MFIWRWLSHDIKAGVGSGNANGGTYYDLDLVDRGMFGRWASRAYEDRYRIITGAVGTAVDGG